MTKSSWIGDLIGFGIGGLVGWGFFRFQEMVQGTAPKDYYKKDEPPLATKVRFYDDEAKKWVEVDFPSSTTTSTSFSFNVGTTPTTPTDPDPPKPKP